MPVQMKNCGNGIFFLAMERNKGQDHAAIQMNLMLNKRNKTQRSPTVGLNVCEVSHQRTDENC